MTAREINQDIARKGGYLHLPGNTHAAKVTRVSTNKGRLQFHTPNARIVPISSWQLLDGYGQFIADSENA